MLLFYLFILNLNKQLMLFCMTSLVIFGDLLLTSHLVKPGVPESITQTNKDKHNGVNNEMLIRGQAKEVMWHAAFLREKLSSNSTNAQIRTVVDFLGRLASGLLRPSKGLTLFQDWRYWDIRSDARCLFSPGVRWLGWNWGKYYSLTWFELWFLFLTDTIHATEGFQRGHHYHLPNSF